MSRAAALAAFFFFNAATISNVDGATFVAAAVANVDGARFVAPGTAQRATTKVVASTVDGATFVAPRTAQGATTKVVASTILAAAQPPAIPEATQLPDGLTLIARKATASPTVALEVWIKCPANGYDAARPGIARLTALAAVEDKSGGSSLRSDARDAGAQIQVSVYHESTEIAILAPAYAGPVLLDKLLGHVLRPHVDHSAFEAARQRMAAQQVASMDMPDEVLRDLLFAHMFASGPLHDSPFGDPKTLAGLTLADVNAFAQAAYVPANEIVVAVGDVDSEDVVNRLTAAAPAAAAPQAMGESALAPYSDAPLAMTRESLNVAGVAIGWAGPPISDERAATAMDFLSDYLANPTQGVLSKVMFAADASADFNGQFVTLRNPGVFYLTASGAKLDPSITTNLIRDAMRNALHRPLSRETFTQAREAFINHLLHDMQTSQMLGDNYGWYFSQGALAYSPSATSVALSGDYFRVVASLTPEYVHAVASRYLQAKPAVIILPRGPVHISGTP